MMLTLIYLAACRTGLQPIDVDREFLVEFDWELDVDFFGQHTVAVVTTKLKALLLYTFRFETQARSRRPHVDLLDTEITISQGPMTARKLIEELVRQLPPGWKATALPA